MKAVPFGLSLAALTLLALATAQACPYHEKTSLLITDSGQEQPQGQSPAPVTKSNDEQRLVDVPTPATDGAN